MRKLGAAILNEPVPATLYRALDAVDTRRQAVQHDENEQRTPPAMDHRSFRDQLTFAIGFAVSHNRELLRRTLKEHITDDAREQLAKRVVEHLELSGFEIDEDQRVMRKRGHGRGW